MSLFDLTGKVAVVTGGTRGIGLMMARGLLQAGARVTVVSPTLTPGLAELVRQDRFSHRARRYRRGDLAGAFLAIAATGDPALNRAIFAEAEAERVLCNAVDDVEHCHFAAPSILRRGDLVLAISTGGRSPALAKRLRAELAERLGPELAVLTDLLGDLRAELMPTRRQVDFATWARRWEEALDHDLAALVRAGHLDEVKEVVRQAVAGPDERKEAVA